MRVHSEVPSFNNIAQMKNMYDAIHEENSSYRESLLVSPHCSKYDRMSFDKFNQDESLTKYIKPFENQQFNKTEVKPKRKIQFDNRKKTEPECSEYYLKPNNQKNLQACVLELQSSIRQKDQRILMLQRNLARLTDKKTQNTQYATPQCERINTVQKFQQYEDSPKGFKTKDKKKQFKNYEQTNDYHTQLQIKIQNYQKQINFLTHNNQELYEQIQKMGQFLEKQKKILNGTILYNQQLQKKLSEMSVNNQQLTNLNASLLQEKQQMMKNYKEQLKLFWKMQKVWSQNHNNAKQNNEMMYQQKVKKQRNVLGQKKILNERNKRCQSNIKSSF